MFTNERLFTIQAFTITRVHCIWFIWKNVFPIKSLGFPWSFLVNHMFDLVFFTTNVSSESIVSGFQPSMGPRGKYCQCWTIYKHLQCSVFLRNLTVDLDLCCCSARIRVACWLRKPPAEPDIWGAWRDEAYNEKRMLFITLLAPWPGSKLDEKSAF